MQESKSKKRNHKHMKINTQAISSYMKFALADEHNQQVKDHAQAIIVQSPKSRRKRLLKKHKIMYRVNPKLREFLLNEP